MADAYVLIYAATRNLYKSSRFHKRHSSEIETVALLLKPPSCIISAAIIGFDDAISQWDDIARSALIGHYTIKYQSQMPAGDA